MKEPKKENYAQIWKDLLKLEDIGQHISVHRKSTVPLIRCVLKNLKEKTNGKIKILEVGCGTAIDSFDLTNLIDVDSYALDYSWDSIVLTKKIGDYYNKQVKLLVSDAFHICFKDKTFDLVFSQGLIEHFEDPIAIIKEQLRILKDDGIIIIDVPQKFNPYTLFKHRLISKGQWPWGWETEYSYYELIKLGRRLGLEPIDKCGHGSTPFLGLAYTKFWPKNLRSRMSAALGKLFNVLCKINDKILYIVEKKYGHLFMQSVAVVFSKKDIMPENNINVCLVSGSFYPMHCGVGDYTFCLSQALAKRKINVSVITKFIKNLPARYSIGNVNVYRIMQRWNMLETLKLMNNLRYLNPVIVHIQYAALVYNNHIMIYFIPLFIKLLIPKSKVVITFHEIVGPGPFWRIWHNIFLKFVECIIVPNNIYMGALLKLYPLLAKKIFLVPVGSNIPQDKRDKPTDTERNMIRLGFGIDEQTLLIGSFGFFFEDKNLEILVRAVKSLIESGNKIKLIFIGGQSDIAGRISKSYQDKLSQYINYLGMDKFVIYTGYVDIENISKVLLSCDTAVLLYKDGVSGRRGTFMGVLSCGLPIITSCGPASMEELVNYKNVLLVKNDDEEQLKQYILELIYSKDLRNQLSSGALELFKMYSWELISKTIINIYNNLTLSGEIDESSK